MDYISDFPQILQESGFPLPHIQAAAIPSLLLVLFLGLCLPVTGVVLGEEGQADQEGWVACTKAALVRACL